MTPPCPAGQPPELVAVGEALIAFVAHGGGPVHEARTFSPHVVGAESNVAIGVARLGHRASFAGRVGDDPFGAMIVRRLLAEGVAVDHVTTDPEAPTAMLFRNLRAYPPAEVTYRRAGSAGSRLQPDDALSALNGLPAGTFVHVSGVTPALSESCLTTALALTRAARSRELQLFVDVNYRTRLWSPEAAIPVLRRLVASASIVTASRSEAALLTGKENSMDAAAALVGLGARIAVIRDRDLGAVASTGSRRPPVVAQSPVSVQAVDAVGAGDAFNAGLIAGMLNGAGLSEAITDAHRCAAAVVGVIGDIEGFPTLRELADSADDVRR
jgi:2-dehydro-3-deoxygluconokinase